MQLTKQTDYSLRALMYLGTHRGRLITIGEISDKLAIPRNNLMKVTAQLARTGFVNTTRGAGGGLSLARSPDDIALGDVVRQTEPTLDLMDCEAADCPLTGKCLLKKAYNRAMRAFMGALDDCRLSDVLENESALDFLPEPKPHRPTRYGPDTEQRAVCAPSD